jgi:hypothetical protein
MPGSRLVNRHAADVEFDGVAFATSVLIWCSGIVARHLQAIDRVPLFGKSVAESVSIPIDQSNDKGVIRQIVAIHFDGAMKARRGKRIGKSRRGSQQSDHTCGKD